MTSVTKAAITNPNVEWKKGQVKVCWQDEVPLKKENWTEGQWKKISRSIPVKLNSQKKIFIKNKLNSEYKKQKTGISFVGWGSCQSSLDSDIVLITINSDDQPLGRASIGRTHEVGDERRLEILPPTKKAFVVINVIETKNTMLSRSAELAYSILHEFGHVAGLRHEQISSDAKFDPNCSEEDLAEESNQESAIGLTVYDPSSIMNYCLYGFLSKVGLRFSITADGKISTNQNIPVSHFNSYTDPLIFKRSNNDVTGSIGLSQSDLKGLRKLYPNL